MSPSHNTIILAVGHPPTAWEATRAAVDLARRTGAALHVLHVGVTVPVEPWPDRMVGSPASQELYDELGEATLAEAMRQVARCGYQSAHPHFLVGAPVAMVLHLVEKLHAELLVLGGNPPAAARCWAIGGPLIGLAHHADCPTLVVRAGCGPWPPARVALADDGQPFPREAAGIAIRIGRLCGADIGAIHTRPAPRQWVAESRGPGNWGRAGTRAGLNASLAHRPGGAGPARATLGGVQVAPPPGRPAGSTLVAAVRRPVRSPGDLLRWVSIGQLLRLAPGPTLVIPA